MHPPWMRNQVQLNAIVLNNAAASCHSPLPTSELAIFLSKANASCHSPLPTISQSDNFRESYYRAEIIVLKASSAQERGDNGVVARPKFEPYSALSGFEAVPLPFAESHPLRSSKLMPIPNWIESAAPGHEESVVAPIVALAKWTTACAFQVR